MLTAATTKSPISEFSHNFSFWNNGHHRLGGGAQQCQGGPLNYHFAMALHVRSTGWRHKGGHWWRAHRTSVESKILSCKIPASLLFPESLFHLNSPEILFFFPSPQLLVMPALFLFPSPHLLSSPPVLLLLPLPSQFVLLALAESTVALLVFHNKVWLNFFLEKETSCI